MHAGGGIKHARVFLCEFQRHAAAAFAGAGDDHAGYAHLVRTFNYGIPIAVE